MKTLIAISLILIIPFSFIYAGTTGKISGRVVDRDNGEPLPGVNIQLEETTLGAATDMEGYYTILNIQPGNYTMKVTMMGYKTIRTSNVRVRIDLTTTMNFQLQPTVLEAGEEVVVVAERPLIQKDITSSQAIVSSEEMQQLPVESFQQVLTLQAGVVQSAGGGIHIRGGRSSEIGYMIDGISVTDPFNASMSVTVENNAIQELQLVSGTFNAEYGQAMSGIVNIVTKEGSKKYTGEVSYYMGDYVSNHKETYFNIEDNNINAINDFQANLSGPIPFTKNKLTFYVSGRYYYNDGFLYGIRRYNPSDSSNFDAPDPYDWLHEMTGDGKIVPMNPGERVSLQWKLTTRLSPGIKITYGGLRNDREYKLYSHRFKYNPDGVPNQYRDGWNHIFTWTHAITPKTFYTLKYSNFYNHYEEYVFKNPDDSRYVNPRLMIQRAYQFYTGGTSMYHYYRTTRTHVAKGEITSQVTRIHQIKAGFEYRSNRIDMEDFTLRYDATTGYKPEIPDFSSPSHDKYRHTPTEIAAYIQDKIELQDMIVNVGLRYDRFDPDGVVPTETFFDDELGVKREGFRDPKKAPKEKASIKHQISPRIGIAYPITDRGVIYFSYGHFLQIPPYSYLYNNPDFEVTGGLSTTIGNANLEPQRTVSYEIGLQQQLTDDIAIDVTGYYKDIRNLLGTEIHETYILGDKYALYINRDYGNVRGITVAFKKRYSDMVSATLDYTYGVAEGNASDPGAAFYDAAAGIEPEKEMVYLDWDQTNTLNATVTLSKPNNWSISLIGNYGSGFPYTPAFRGLRTAIENSERKPDRYNVDLRMHKRLRLWKLNTLLFLNIYNIFDRKNEEIVYSDTGRSDYTLIPRYTGEVRGANTLEEYLIRPDYFSAPRQVKFGFGVSF